MPVHVCSDPDYLKNHGPACDASLSSSIHCHWLVYANAEGVTGFDRDEKAREMAKCLIADCWLIDLRDSVFRQISLAEHWLATIRRAVNPAATMLRSPDATLLADANEFVEYTKALRVSQMRQRYGKDSQIMTPPPIAKLFAPLSNWDTDTMRYALDHSRGLLVWEFRGGEYGLHCRALSLDATTWSARVEQCVQRRNESRVVIEPPNKMPAW